MIQELKTKIAAGDIQYVLEKLLSYDDKEVHNEALQLSARYESFKKRKRLNVVSQNELNIEENNIINSIIQLIETLSHKKENVKTGFLKETKAPLKIIFPSLIGVVILISYFQFFRLDNTFAITVLINKEYDGIPEYIEGKVLIQSGDFEMVKPVDKSEKVIFSKLPESLIGKKFQLEFIPAIDSLINKFDSIYTFEESGFFDAYVDKKELLSAEEREKRKMLEAHLSRLKTADPGKCFYLNGQVKFQGPFVDSNVTMTEEIIIKPAHREGAQFEIKKIQVKTSSGGLEWRLRSKSCLSKGGEILCITEIPAQYKMFDQSILIKDGEGELVEPEKFYVPTYFKNSYYKFSDDSVIKDLIEVLCIDKPPTKQTIKLAQQALLALDFDIEVTGDIGEKTIAALLAIQNENGLDRTAQLDNATLKFLGINN